MSPYTIRDISCYVVCKMTDRLILLCNMLRCTVLHSTRPHPQKSLTKKIHLSLLHKSKFWGGRNTIYFQLSQIQIFFQQIAWGRGTSGLLVRQGRLLYLSTILRNKSVSESLLYSFNITQTPMLHIAGWLLLWGSFQADFILNYSLSNFLEFPWIFLNFLSNSLFPPSLTGRLEQLKSPCI